jgi:arylsulfatase A-like enzyme
LITLSDLYPTILELCNLSIPDGISGKAFGSGSAPIISEFYSPKVGAHRALYDGKYKLITDNENVELYDLEQDPLERINVAEALPDVTASMVEKLEAWKKKHTPRYDVKTKAPAISQEALEGLKALGYIK